MPITVQWDNDEKTIILCQYTGAFAFEEMNKAMVTENELIYNVQHPVGVIFDWRNGEPVTKKSEYEGPLGNLVSGVSQFGGMITTPETPQGAERRSAAIMVMVADKEIVDAMNATAMQFANVLNQMGVNPRFTTDLEEARQIIREHLKNHSE